MNGILILNKDGGMSSHTAVAKLRRLFGGVKAGHCGTLDPMATGVLPVMLGAATPFSEFVTGGVKKYRATALLGTVTDTDDITGRKIGGGDFAGITARDVEAAAAAFVGKIEQLPPVYSAIAVDGVRLYKRARAGEQVVRPVRKVEIFRIGITKPLSGGEFEFEVECGKGTYIRSLIRDIGQALGAGACMKSLTRLESAGYGLCEAYSLAQLERMDERGRNAAVKPVESLFEGLPVVRCDEFYKRLLLCGQAVMQKKLGSSIPAGEFALLDTARFCGLLLAEVREGEDYLKFYRRYVLKDDENNKE